MSLRSEKLMVRSVWWSFANLLLLQIRIRTGLGCNAFLLRTTQTHRRRTCCASSPFFLQMSSDATTTSTAPGDEEEDKHAVSFDSLIDMDVVIFIKHDDEAETKLFGALQEDGRLAPLSAWTMEPAFGECIEFLVDEEDRFTIEAGSVRLHSMVQESELSYGSRQCHRGVSNPHGEESELLYYVDQSVVETFDVKVVLKPDLEIL